MGRTGRTARLLGAAAVVVIAVVALAMEGIGIDVEADGPVVHYDVGWIPVGQSGMDAIVSGVVDYDDGCLTLDGSPVVWPDGTSWDEDGQRVRLPGGDFAEAGDRVNGAGGWTTAPDWPLDDCPGGEAAVFNSDSDVSVER